MSYTRILLAYDGSKSSDDALEQAITLTRENYAIQLEVIHVYNFPTIALGEVMYSPSQSQEKEFYNYSQAIVEKAKERVKSITLSSVILKYGNPAKVILEHAEATHCDLIVIGNKGHGAVLEFMLGSVCHNVVQHAKIPVLVVK